MNNWMNDWKKKVNEGYLHTHISKKNSLPDEQILRTNEECEKQEASIFVAWVASVSQVIPDDIFQGCPMSTQNLANTHLYTWDVWSTENKVSCWRTQYSPVAIQTLIFFFACSAGFASFCVFFPFFTQNKGERGPPLDQPLQPPA